MSQFKNVSSNKFNYNGYVIITETNEIKGINYVSYGIYNNDKCILFISKDVYKASIYNENYMYELAIKNIK